VSVNDHLTAADLEPEDTPGQRRFRGTSKHGPCLDGHCGTCPGTVEGPKGGKGPWVCTCDRRGHSTPHPNAPAGSMITTPVAEPVPVTRPRRKRRAT
jgi:hypothetical protein